MISNYTIEYIGRILCVVILVPCLFGFYSIVWFIAAAFFVLLLCAPMQNYVKGEIVPVDPAAIPGHARPLLSAGQIRMTLDALSQGGVDPHAYAGSEEIAILREQLIAALREAERTGK